MPKHRAENPVNVSDLLSQKCKALQEDWDAFKQNRRSEPQIEEYLREQTPQERHELLPELLKLHLELHHNADNNQVFPQEYFDEFRELHSDQACDLIIWQFDLVVNCRGYIDRDQYL